MRCLLQEKIEKMPHETSLRCYLKLVLQKNLSRDNLKYAQKMLTKLNNSVKFVLLTNYITRRYVSFNPGLNVKTVVFLVTIFSEKWSTANMRGLAQVVPCAGDLATAIASREVTARYDGHKTTQPHMQAFTSSLVFGFEET